MNWLTRYLLAEPPMAVRIRRAVWMWNFAPSVREWVAVRWCLRRHRHAPSDGALRCLDCHRGYVATGVCFGELFDQRTTYHPDGRKPPRFARRHRLRV